MLYCGYAFGLIVGVGELGRTSSATCVRRLATEAGGIILATSPSTLTTTICVFKLFMLSLLFCWGIFR